MPASKKTSSKTELPKKTSRNAIVFTANTPHVVEANLMISSLFDKTKGNFEGDLWVISTHLDKRCQRYLDSIGVKYLINPLVEVQNWKYRDAISKAQPEYISGKLDVDDAFLLYRNKRMSKLIVCDWVEKFGHMYDSMALCDNDLYFQKDMNELFVKTQVDGDVLWYWQEENRNLPGTNLWKKNFHYTRLHDTDKLDFGEHEINIGFVISKPDLMKEIFSEVKDLFSTSNIEIFRDCKWHDQDLVRLIRARTPERFRLFDEGDVLHLCNGGNEVSEERYPAEFYHTKTDEKPYIIHFAGGLWKGYPSISQSYRVDVGSFFFMNEQSDQYDSIRALCSYDPFDLPSPLFSKHNIETKASARKRWMDLKKTSDRKSILFFSWLDTGSHLPLKDKLEDFLAADQFDLAIIDGNVHYRKFGDLSVEDLPDLLARVTQTVRNTKFARQYGYKRDDIPEDAISGAIAALVKEYSCSERAARAVANAAYDYLTRAVAFYQPDCIVCWGTYLLSPRILKHICADLGIPFITSELGVLGNTLAFDCLGHMGQSWVAQHPDLFNGLEIDDADQNNAQRYLDRVISERPSRNIRLDVPEKTQKVLEKLENSAKKVVVYVGSNDAFSGQVPYDNRAKTYHSPYYEDNEDVVAHLSEVFGEDDNIELVYKPHPISITRGLDLSQDYPGITVIQDANLDDCIEIADLVISKVSQGSYEALLRDTPVLMLGINQINSSEAVYKLSSRRGLRSNVQNALKKGYTSKQRASFEDHVARLLKYYLFNVSGKEGAQPQSQMVETIASLLDGTAPDYLKPEQDALLATKDARALGDLTAPKISVIMPIYNGEDYLAECIGSLLNQTLVDFELLCVNNGSTDSSQDIVDYFVARDPRVRSFYQEEPNQRTARNFGVENARGKYLHFCDCDDLLAPETFETIYGVIEEKKADVVYFFFNEMYDIPKDGEPRYRSYMNYLPEGDLFKMEDAHKPFFSQYPFPWAKLFNKEFFLQNNLFFDLDCDNFDDNPQNLRTLLSSDNIYVCNKAFYKFRIHTKSMTQSVNPRAYGMLDAVRIMNKIYTEFDCYDHYQQYYVPYKAHLLHFAWGRLPDELRRDYFQAIPSLFLPGDEDYFRKDSLYSMFDFMRLEKVEFIESALRGEKTWAPKPVAQNKPVAKGKTASLSGPQKALLKAIVTVGGSKMSDRDRHRILNEPFDYFGKAKHSSNIIVRNILNKLGPEIPDLRSPKGK